MSEHGDDTDSFDMHTDPEDADQMSSAEERISQFVRNLPSDLNTIPSGKQRLSRRQHHRANSSHAIHPEDVNVKHGKHRHSASVALSDAPRPSAHENGIHPDLISAFHPSIPETGRRRSIPDVQDQEQLFEIQSNLKLHIGTETTLILSQFLDMMSKIAPHITPHDASNIFNQMDASNHGQIISSLLLHDEFLARIILGLYKQSSAPGYLMRTPSTAGTQHSVVSASTVEYWNLEADLDNIDINTTSAKDLMRKLKSQHKANMKLQQWILEHGQPAIEKVGDLERQLDVYEQERHEKVDELQTFQARLSVMDDMQTELRRHKSASIGLLLEKDSLLIAMEESEQLQRSQRRKYEAALREASKYKQLAQKLEGINNEFCKRNETLTERLSALQADYEAQGRLMAEYDEEMHQEMAIIHDAVHHSPKPGDALHTPAVEDGPSLSGMSALEQESSDTPIRVSVSSRARAVTLKMTVKSDGGSDDGIMSMDEDIAQRQRGNTLGHGIISPPSVSPKMPGIFSDDDLLNGNAMIINNVVDQQPYTIPLAANKPRHRYRFESAASSYSTVVTAVKDGSFRLRSPSGDVRKQIEEELRADYELKLRQKEIETVLRLHKSNKEIHDQYRKSREQDQAEIAELKRQLTEQREISMHHRFNDRISMEDHKVNYMEDAGSSSSMTGNGNSDDDEKQVYDENFTMQEADSLEIDESVESFPLLAEHKSKQLRQQMEKLGSIKEVGQFGDKKENDLNVEPSPAPPQMRRERDEPCFSCFNLLSGRGF